VLAYPCPDCGAEMVLRWASFAERLFYGCVRWPECTANHGAHPNGYPLGKPADRDTRRARSAAHRAFDRLHNGRGAPMTRTAAYAWMRVALRLTDEAAHIALFGREECSRLVTAVREFFGEKAPPPLRARMQQSTVCLERFQGLDEEELI
jgi:hypothetical protein